MNIDDLEVHELANLFPALKGEELDILADDIKERGLLDPITLYEGKILDGRNRYGACQLAGVKLGPENVEMFEEKYPDADPALFVIAKNIHRRHLKHDVRAVLAAQLYKRMKQPHGGDRKSEEYKSKVQKGTLGPSSEEELKKAAAATHVGVRAVKQAAALEKQAPELVEEVKTSKTTLHKAVRQAQKAARGTEHDEALQRISEICGKSFMASVKDEQIRGMTKANEVIEFAKLDDGTMQALLPGLRLGWSLKDSRRYLEMDLSPAHSIEQAIKLLLSKGEESLERDFDGIKLMLVDLRTDEQKAGASVAAAGTKAAKKKRPQKAVPQPSLEQFVEYAKTRGIDVKKAGDQYDAWDAGDWCDGDNNPILNWKGKLNTFAKAPFGVFAGKAGKNGQHGAAKPHWQKPEQNPQDEIERQYRMAQSGVHANSEDRVLHPGRFESCPTCIKKIEAKLSKIRTAEQN